MTKCCATCQWYSESDFICLNEDSKFYMTGKNNTCPLWENYDFDMYGDTNNCD